MTSSPTAGSEALMTHIAGGFDYELVGRGPYYSSFYGTGAFGVDSTYRTAFRIASQNNTPELTFSVGSGAVRDDMRWYYQSGGLRARNTTGDRTPGTMRGNPSVTGPNPSKAFVVMAPDSTNTGLNYRQQQQTTEGTHGNNYGWSPFFSVVSGSGAIRASDGRYYINSNPGAPIIPSSPLYDPKNPD